MGSPPALPQTPLSCLMCTKPQCLCSFSLSSQSSSAQFGVSSWLWLCTPRTVCEPKPVQTWDTHPPLPHLLDTLSAVQCISVYRLYSLGSDYSFLKDTMMFWGNFKILFVFFIKIKYIKKLVLQALFYGKNSSSKYKSFLLKLEPEA